jgi:hypothetical protein
MMDDENSLKSCDDIIIENSKEDNIQNDADENEKNDGTETK